MAQLFDKEVILSGGVAAGPMLAGAIKVTFPRLFRQQRVGAIVPKESKVQGMKTDHSQTDAVSGRLSGL